jgi:molecular chaperone DnaK
MPIRPPAPNTPTRIPMAVEPTLTRGGNVGYTLGLDLGTTSTAAAIGDGNTTRIFNHPSGASVIPSVVAINENGSFLIGEDAERHGVLEPTAVARQFKRRFGDTTPLLLRGTPVAANDLVLQVALAVVGVATEVEGAPPDHVVVCHPANWGLFKISLLEDTLNNSALPPHTLISEPHAAAIHYAGLERVEPGTKIAVYDLGGGTFDVALLTKKEAGWDLIGRPGGIERLGGIDLDTALFQHVLAAANIDLNVLDDNDPSVGNAVRRLRIATRDAKHALSVETATTVAFDLPGPGGQASVRVTRLEFEQLIGPAIDRTLAALDTTIEGAELSVTDVDLVLLVGGSSRIPLIGQRIASHTGLPVATDAHPKHVTALGAAAFVEAAAPTSEAPVVAPAVAADQIGSMFPDLPHISDGPEPDFMQRRRPPADVPPVIPESAPPIEPVTAFEQSTRQVAASIEAPTRAQSTDSAPTHPAQTPEPRPKPSRRWTVAAVLLILAAVVAAALVFRAQTGDSPEADGDELAIEPITSTTSSETATSIESAASALATTLLPEGFEPCSGDAQPLIGTDYRVVEISQDDPDGGLNGRRAPTIDAEVEVVFPSNAPLQASGACAVDSGDRVWWQVRAPRTLVWVAARFVEPR